jgi:hypothetical protein
MSARTLIISGSLTDPTLTNTMLTNPGPGALSIAFWGVTFVSSTAHTTAGAVTAQSVTVSCGGVTVITYNVIVIGSSTVVSTPHYDLEGAQYLLSAGQNVTLTTTAGPTNWRHNVFATIDSVSGS